MKIKVKDIKYTLLIMMLIWFSGSLFYKVYNDAFLLFTLAYSAWSIVRKKGKYSGILKKSIIFCIALLVSCLITVYKTHGSLSVGAALNVVLHFLFTFCVIEDVGGKDEFIKRYCSIIKALAIISLVIFTVQLVSPSLLRTIFLHQRIVNSSYDFYTIWVYTMPSNQTTRNCGLMTEPGLYQILLNTALFFYLFNETGITPKKKKNAILILSITIITAQSAVGILNLMALIFCYLVNTNKKNKRSTNNAKILIAGMALASMLVITFVPNIPIVSDFTSKLFVDGQFNISGGTGRYRMISMMTDLEVFKRNIFGSGYDNYYNLFGYYKVENTVIHASSCGLTYCLAVFGIITYVLIIGYYLMGFFVSSEKFFVRFSILAIFLLTSWTQPLLYYPPFIAAIWVIMKKREDVGEKRKALSYETSNKSFSR